MQRELVVSDCAQRKTQRTDLASKATIVADDEVGALGDRDSDDVPVLAVDTGDRVRTGLVRTSACGAPVLPPSVRRVGEAQKFDVGEAGNQAPFHLGEDHRAETRPVRPASNSESNRSQESIGTSTSASSTATGCLISLSRTTQDLRRRPSSDRARDDAGPPCHPGTQATRSAPRADASPPFVTAKLRRRSTSRSLDGIR